MLLVLFLLKMIRVKILSPYCVLKITCVQILITVSFTEDDSAQIPLLFCLLKMIGI
jgi:hypothetical protein